MQNGNGAGSLPMPPMGLGTYGRRGPEGQAAIETGLGIGYRLLDTAQDYHTEQQCGAALAASGLPRADVFVTTKIRAANLGAGKVQPSLEQSLAGMGLDYVDLTLIHWPSPNGEVPLETYIEQLGDLLDTGLTRHIGVSNFTIGLIEKTLGILGGRPLFNNQVEVHPFLQNRKLVDHCKTRGISITCYMPIAHGRVGAEPVLQQIATRHGATPEQVSLAFLLAQDLAVIPSSAHPDRMRINFEARNLRLSEDDITRIRGLDRGLRLIDPAFGPAWD